MVGTPLMKKPESGLQETFPQQLRESKNKRRLTWWLRSLEKSHRPQHKMSLSRHGKTVHTTQGENSCNWDAYSEGGCDLIVRRCTTLLRVGSPHLNLAASKISIQFKSIQYLYNLVYYTILVTDTIQYLSRILQYLSQLSSKVMAICGAKPLSSHTGLGTVETTSLHLGPSCCV